MEGGEIHVKRTMVKWREGVKEEQDRTGRGALASVLYEAFSSLSLL